MNKNIVSLILFVLAVSFAATSQARPAPESFADSVEKTIPAVVSVSATRISQPTTTLNFPPGSPFEEFFKEFFGGNLPEVDARKAIMLGSGFIVSEDGYVLTNNHVIENVNEALVTLNDGSTHKAVIVGKDKKTDIALIKISVPRALTKVTFADSDKVRIGDWIFTIGNPFGLGNTVTAGIVSARSRDIQAGPYDDFLQTDASINRGNSGGPMFNADGELVGMNTAIFSPSGGSVGIGFAIPSNLVSFVYSSMKSDGYVRRGKLGIKVQSVTEEIAKSLKRQNTEGALVANVDSDGSSSNSGIKSGDVITAFNGKPIKNMRQLPRMAAESAIGSKAELTVWRNGETLKFTSVIGEMEREQEPVRTVAANAPNVEDPAAQTKTLAFRELGLTLADSSPAIRQKYRLPKNTRGAVIIGVQAESNAELKGLRMTDVIIEFNKSPVNSVADVDAQMKKITAAKQDAVFMLVDRAGERFFVALKLAENGGGTP